MADLQAIIAEAQRKLAAKREAAAAAPPKRETPKPTGRKGMLALAGGLSVRKAPEPEEPAPVAASEPAEEPRRDRRFKLSREDVEAIKASTETHRAVAERFGVSRETIKAIRSGRRQGSADPRASAEPQTVAPSKPSDPEPQPVAPAKPSDPEPQPVAPAKPSDPEPQTVAPSKPSVPKSQSGPATREQLACAFVLHMLMRSGHLPLDPALRFRGLTVDYEAAAEDVAYLAWRFERDITKADFDAALALHGIKAA